MKDRLFSKAVIRLTLFYTAIFAAICVGFSVAFFLAANHELSRPIHPRTGIIQEDSLLDNIPDDFRNIIIQRDKEMSSNLVIALIIIDSSVLVLGACASYFLARRTIQPIQKMAEQQANFISDASHELRTPLTAIAMENEVALRSQNLTKTELTDIIKSNLEETKKLQVLTNHLLKLSQDEPLQLAEINLTDSVNQVVTSLTPIANRKRIAIKNQISPALITTNMDALTEILTILIENAIKYSPEKSTITISYKDDKLSVRDQGIGISKEDLPHIFDRFYRAEKSRTSNGYGLGLPLARQLALQIHLKITAANNKTKGSTFFIEPLN